MPDHSQSFIAKSAEKTSDREHRRKINFNIGRYNAVVPAVKTQFSNVNLAREKAKNIKWKAIENLDKMLESFEAKMMKSIMSGKPLIG
jgi:L-lactate dehydrogenase complex protein LldF